MAEFIDLHAYLGEDGSVRIAVLADGEHAVDSSFGMNLQDPDGFEIIRIQADEIEKL